MHSIYKGTISHSRKKDAQHSFNYASTMLFLDIDDIKNAFSHNIFWSYEKFNLASFYRKDFFGDSKKSLKSEIVKLLNLYFFLSQQLLNQPGQKYLEQRLF